MTKKEIIFKLKSLLCDLTEECFHVDSCSDSAGHHYCLFVVKESIDIPELRSSIAHLNLRRCIIVYNTPEQIKYKISEDEHA